MNLANNYTFTYQAPSFLKDFASKKEQAVYDACKYPESSNNIMCHQEVLDFFQKGRTTIIQWRKERGFPEPISKAPFHHGATQPTEWGLADGMGRTSRRI